MDNTVTGNFLGRKKYGCQINTKWQECHSRNSSEKLCTEKGKKFLELVHFFFGSVTVCEQRKMGQTAADGTKFLMPRGKFFFRKC